MKKQCEEKAEEIRVQGLLERQSLCCLKLSLCFLWTTAFRLCYTEIYTFYCYYFLVERTTLQGNRRRM